MRDDHDRLAVMVTIMKSSPRKEGDEEESKHVYLVRHGKTSLNGEGSTSIDKIRGWIDVPLSKEGKAQAECLANWLKDKKIDVIYTSDLSRAYNTAKIISEQTTTKINRDRNLRPWDLGFYTGKETKKVLGELQDHIKNPNRLVAGGETFNEFLKRFIPALGAILEDVDIGRFKNVVVVAHYRNLKAAQAWIESGMKDNKVSAEIMMKDDIPTASIMEFEKNNGEWGYEIISYDEIEKENEDGSGIENGDEEKSRDVKKEKYGS